MEIRRAVELVGVVAAEAVTIADVQASLAASTALKAWLASRDVSMSRTLMGLNAADRTVSPEREFALATRGTDFDGWRATARVDVIDLLPIVEAGLGNGVVTVAHLEIITGITKRLNSDERARFAEFDSEPAAAASTLPPSEFRKIGNQLLRKVLAPSSAIDRFKHQQAKTFLQHWVDRDTGMFCVRGEFDPETGTRLHGRLQAKLEALFHDGDTAGEQLRATTGTRDEQIARQDHLRAKAFIALTEPNNRNAGATSGRPEIVIIIDEQTLANGAHRRGRLAVNGGAELPIETVQRLACDANTITVHVDHHGMPLNVGRAQRTATTHQRRALATMYATCAAPSCEVNFEQCEPHHIKHWQHGGRTDLANLIPLCFSHHRAVHEGGWQIALTPRRNAEFTLPNGTKTVVPPKIPWAG